MELEIGHTLETIGARGGAREPDHHHLEQHLPQDSRDITGKLARDKMTEVEMTDSSTVNDGRAETIVAV